jgi:hypothetical protein
MNNKRKVGRPKKIVEGCSAQQFRRIRERSKKIIFNDDIFNVNIDDLVPQKPSLMNLTNKINQYNDETDENEEEMIRDNISDVQFVVDYEKSDDGQCNFNIDNNFDNENFKF